MWRKHGIWTQIALCITVVMTVASCMSWQFLTLWEDVYWSIVLLISSCIQFCAAEHGEFGLTVHTWQMAEKYRLFVVSSMTCGWALLKWETQYHFGLLIPFTICAIFFHKHHKIILIIGGITQMMANGPWILCSMLIVANIGVSHFFKQSIHHSIASQTMKKAYACVAIRSVLEALILWSIRCQHRFPYTFRWTPIIAGFLVAISAAAWAQKNIKDTKVSRNAIIKQMDHNIAASLTAAKQCPQCRACVTSLDMESSF